MKSEFDIQKHMLVPKHEIMTDEEISNEFSNLDYSFKNLPKIKVDDPVAESIGAKPGDVLRITRESQTAGVFVTYRIVEEWYEFRISEVYILISVFFVFLEIHYNKFELSLRGIILNEIVRSKLRIMIKWFSY